ncbi:MAG TPA: hypothetical protein VI932_05670 [Bacteroidota bacterium]|nr:hypothetical protein [Bacteroidota bacterium]
MSFVPAPDFPVENDQPQGDTGPIPPLRWIMVGYFFWVGIFLGALIMHSATGL